MPRNSEPTPEVQDESGASTIPPSAVESDPARAAVLDEEPADVAAVDDRSAADPADEHRAADGTEPVVTSDPVVEPAGDVQEVKPTATSATRDTQTAPELVSPATPQPVTAEAVAATTEVHPVASPERESSSADAEPTRVMPAPVPAPTPTPAPTAAAGHVSAQAVPPREVVYVQAPTPPKPRHNRGFGALISLIGALVFALLYLAVGGVIITLTPGADVDSTFRDFGLSAAFWVPVCAYLVLSVLFALIANRAAWWAHVLGSLVVALLTYGASVGVLALMFEVPAMTPGEAAGWFALIAVNPFLIAAAVLARECALWFGLAIASRGRRVRARNTEERARFDSEVAEQRAAYERARPS